MTTGEEEKEEKGEEEKEEKSEEESCAWSGDAIRVSTKEDSPMPSSCK